MTDLSDINSTLQLIARQLGNQTQHQANATPTATASTSPVSYGFGNLGTSTATTIIVANSNRYGLIFHNPGTANVYVYPSAMTSAPTVAAPGGAFLIYPGSTLSLPSPLFANTNGAWSAFSGTGSDQAFTVVEFI